MFNLEQKCDCPICNLFFGICNQVKNIESKINPKIKYEKK